MGERQAQTKQFNVNIGRPLDSLVQKQEGEEEDVYVIIDPKDIQYLPSEYEYSVFPEDGLDIYIDPYPSLVYRFVNVAQEAGITVCFSNREDLRYYIVGSLLHSNSLIDKAYGLGYGLGVVVQELLKMGVKDEIRRRTSLLIGSIVYAQDKGFRYVPAEIAEHYLDGKFEPQIYVGSFHNLKLKDSLDKPLGLERRIFEKADGLLSLIESKIHGRFNKHSLLKIDFEDKSFSKDI